MPQAIYDNISKYQLALRRAEKLDKEWQAAVRLMDKNKTPNEARPSYRLFRQNKYNFDPEGTGYDYYSALKEGITPNPDEKGEYHWDSRSPRSGLLLKGEKHKTWPELVLGEKDAGYEIFKKSDGRFYSRSK